MLRCCINQSQADGVRGLSRETIFTQLREPDYWLQLPPAIASHFWALETRATEPNNQGHRLDVWGEAYTLSFSRVSRQHVTVTRSNNPAKCCTLTVITNLEFHGHADTERAKTLPLSPREDTNSETIDSKSEVKRR